MRPASSPRMVGRQAELGVLLDALADARSGTPRTVIVRGEAGIGKSRLLEELRNRARELDPDVVLATGQCIDVGAVGAPFTPIRRMLHELVDGVGAETLQRAAGSPLVVATLSTLVPELPTDGEAPSGRADFVAEALERVIERLSADHLLVLVIEDLHWGDSATLGLLRTLAVTLRGSHVLLVGTYRSDDVGRGHPLRPVLAELDRSRLVSGLEIARLTAAEVLEQIGLIADGIDTATLEEVVQRSEGVPFFVEELIALEGDSLPDTLRGLVLARHDRLSETAREVVGVVAAGGVHVSHTVLAEVYPGDAGSLREGLHEALAANVLVADHDGYRFRHALIHEAVHDDLLPSERATLHQRYAEAADARAASGDLTCAALAAEHWLQARDLPRAFDSMVLARRHAQETFAPLAAAGFGEQLLEIWPHVPDAAERAGIDSPALHNELALLWSGNDPARALRIARAGLHGDVEPLTRGMLLGECAVALFNLGRLSECAEHTADAIAQLDEADPAHWSALARLLAMRSALPGRVIGADASQQQQLADRALELAELVGDTRAMRSVLGNASWAQIAFAGLEASLATARRMRELTVSATERLEADLIELDVLVRLGRFDEAIGVGEPAVADAIDVGLERYIGSMLAANLAEAHLGRGTVPRAVELLERCLTLLSILPLFQSFALRLLVSARTWDDDLDSAEELQHREHALITDAQSEDPEERIGWAEVDCEQALARLEDERGVSERARLLAAATSAALTLGEPDFLTGPGVSRRLLPAAVRTLAEARIAGADVDVDRLRATVEAATAAQPDDDAGRALRLLVDAEMSRAEGTDDPETWRAAVESPDLAALPVRHRHYASYRHAAALVRHGRLDDAAAPLAALPRQADADGVALVGRWARDLASRAGLARGGAPSAPTQLTPREQQVLDLVAEGLTNREIGERLFISHKTASVHVSAILRKLGAATRTEAAYRAGALR